MKNEKQSSIIKVLAALILATGPHGPANGRTDGQALSIAMLNENFFKVHHFTGCGPHRTAARP